jgi:hypothetical protein
MALFGKIAPGGDLVVSRSGLQSGNCNSAFASAPLTLVTQVGNTITVQDSTTQQWVNRYDLPLGAQPEWVPFRKTP